jgi:hypothetical protein
MWSFARAHTHTHIHTVLGRRQVWTFATVSAGAALAGLATAAARADDRGVGLARAGALAAAAAGWLAAGLAARQVGTR